MNDRTLKPTYSNINVLLSGCAFSISTDKMAPRKDSTMHVISIFSREITLNKNNKILYNIYNSVLFIFET